MKHSGRKAALLLAVAARATVAAPAPSQQVEMTVTGIAESAGYGVVDLTDPFGRRLRLPFSKEHRGQIQVNQSYGVTWSQGSGDPRAGVVLKDNEGTFFSPDRSFHVSPGQLGVGDVVPGSEVNVDFKTGKGFFLTVPASADIIGPDPTRPHPAPTPTPLIDKPGAPAPSPSPGAAYDAGRPEDARNVAC